MQRGFVRGRQLAANALDLDTAARLQGFEDNFDNSIDCLWPVSVIEDMPIVPLWDVAAAFPTLAHQLQASLDQIYFSGRWAPALSAEESVRGPAAEACPP